LAQTKSAIGGHRFGVYTDSICIGPFLLIFYHRLFFEVLSLSRTNPDRSARPSRFDMDEDGLDYAEKADLWPDPDSSRLWQQP
jgi:hypothetical protein